MMEQTIANNYTIPANNVFSGFPIHNNYTEKAGLIYLVVFPYYFLHSILTIVQLMYLIQILFAILGIWIAFRFSYELSNNIPTALFGAFLYATIPAAISRNMLSIYRGDSFVPIALGAILLMILYLYKEWNNKSSKWYMVMLSLLMILFYILALTLNVWNGAVYIIAVIPFAIISIIIYGIVKDYIYLSDGKKALRTTFILMIIIVIIGWFIFLGLPNLREYSSTFTNQKNPLVYTTSELQPSSILYLITAYLFSFFLMFMSILGFLIFNEKNDTQNITFILLGAMLLIGLPMAMSQQRWSSLIAIPVAIFGSLFIRLLNNNKEILQVQEAKINQIFILILLISMIAPVYLFGKLEPLQSANSNYHQTMLWIQNNTPKNSTFMTEWADGSAVEAWAYRQSYIDSVGGEHYNLIVNFSKFLGAQKGNFSFLNKTHPNYLITRKYWIDLSNSIMLEGEFPITKSLAGTNFEMLVNQTPNSISSIDRTISLYKFYEKYNTTIYQINYSR